MHSGTAVCATVVVCLLVAWNARAQEATATQEAPPTQAPPTQVPPSPSGTAADAETTHTRFKALVRDTSRISSTRLPTSSR